MAQQTIVTRDSLQAMLNDSNATKVMHIVGRALTAIFQYQTENEKVSNDTKDLNGVGFAGCDGRSGSLTAKSYLKHKTLQPWQVERWTKLSEKTGYARLCKYHNQLNTIALLKQQVTK